MQFIRLAIFILFLSAAALAQEPVLWALESNVKDKAVKAGEKFEAVLKAEIDPGWYLYALEQPEGGPIATTIKIPEGIAYEIAGKIISPQPIVKPDPNFIIDDKPLVTKFFADRASFKLPIQATRDNNTSNFAVNVRFQACNDTYCLPPKTVKVTFAGVDGAKKPDMPDAAPNIEIYGQQSAEQSLWSFIWLAVTFGAISLLTPCVFPMIPITVSYFMKHSDGDHRKTIKLATVYSAGIIATFSLLGMLLAVVFGAAGINLFAANPWVNLFIATIFIFFAFNLFGFYEISIPPSVLTKLDRITRTEEGKGSAYLGALLMGLTFTLTSFTCTSPFIGTILVSTSQGDWKMPLLGMFVFSLIFALPFFFLAIAPRFLHSLPRSGGWLNSVKVVMGFLEIAAAMKFLSNVDLVWGADSSGTILNYGSIFTREVVLIIWIIIGLAIAAYILGLFRFRHDAQVRKLSGWRVAFSMAFVTICVYLANGALGNKLGELESFLPPKNSESAFNILGNRDEELKWITNNFEAALKQAKTDGKRVFVDFTGYTCTNCRWMEANMFTRPEVKAEMLNYVLVSLYTDGDGEIYERQQQFQERTFQTVALPYYAVFDADGQARAAFPGLTRNAGEFVDFLKKSKEN